MTQPRAHAQSAIRNPQSALDPAAATVELNDRDSARLLTAAERRRAGVGISPPRCGTTVSGLVTRVTDRTVDVAARDIEPLDQAHDQSAPCTVTVQLPGQSFWFDTTVIQLDRSTTPAQITLRRPVCVTTHQRRRFWRAPVRQSSTVLISTDQNSPICRGTMLNVSPDGLACRTGRDDVEQYAVDDRLTVRFTIEGDDDPYELPVQMKSITPASGPDQVILRFQFIFPSLAPEIRARLKRTIGHAPAPTDSIGG